jgi:hypothetical protein
LQVVRTAHSEPEGRAEILLGCPPVRLDMPFRRMTSGTRAAYRAGPGHAIPTHDLWHKGSISRRGQLEKVVRAIVREELKRAGLRVAGPELPAYNLPNGDAVVLATIGDAQSQSGVLVTVGQ